MRIVLACLLLAGCASVNDISQLDSAQLESVSVAALCKPYVQGPNVAAERDRRGLSDCSLADQVCIRAHIPAGTPGYAQCRNKALLEANSDCYFNGPDMGRLAQAVVSKQVICNGPPP